MSVSSDSYYSNAIVGVPQVGADVNIYEQHSTPRFAIGTKFERQDSAVFRYAHFGAAVDSAGLVLSTDTSESGTTYTLSLTSSSTYQMPDDPSGVYPNCKGSKYVILTKGSVAADDYAGGYLAATSANAQKTVGITYRIKSNTATGNPVASNFRVELYDRLKATISSDANAVIAGNKWTNLKTVGYTTTDMVLAGISILSSGTTYPFGWVQTRGITAVLGDIAGSLALNPLGGRLAMVGTAANGTVMMAQLITAGVQPILNGIVGIYVQNGSASSYNMVDVKIE